MYLGKAVWMSQVSSWVQQSTVNLNVIVEMEVTIDQPKTSRMFGLVSWHLNYRSLGPQFGIEVVS